jgi:replicative superfamily II helicase
MPGLMARFLIELIEDKIVHLVMATSTLSEGVNLPFETVLVPSLQRWNGDIGVRSLVKIT